MIRSGLLVAFFLINFGSLYSQTLIPLQSGKKTSIRGLSVLNDSTAWLSGSKGWTARSTDRGRSWTWNQIPGYEKLDFRDIEAFSDSRAIMVSAGTPAVILLTTNGGASWQEVYRNDSPDIFLDGMDFWNQEEGIVYGDPIKGKMQLLSTTDGGRTWHDISDNLQDSLAEGEASFAASGTAIRCLKGGHTWIATGGAQSRIFYSSDFGENWSVYPIPIIQGKSSTGPFSIAFRNRNHGIAAGGDYLADTSRTDNLVLTKNGGQTWTKPVVNPFGYRSAIEYLGKRKLLASGTSGADYSADGGRTWINISTEAFNTVRKAKKGSWVLLTGNNGKITEFKPR